MTTETIEHVIEGIGAPTNAPPSLCAHYINTVTGEQYLAKGTKSAGDWVLQGQGMSQSEAEESFQPKGDYATRQELDDELAGLTPGEVGDILVTLRDPGLRYLLADGSPVDPEAYPDLAPMLGSAPGGWTEIEGLPEEEMSGAATDGAGVWCISNWYGLYRSTDDGVTFEKVDGVPGNRYCVDTDRHGTWVTSGSGGTYRSIDNGLSWSLVPSFPGYVTILVAGKDDVWIGLEDDDTKLIVSTNGGETWVTRQTPVLWMRGLATNGKGTWLVGGNGDGASAPTLARSIDNGATWEAIETTGWKYSRKLVVADGNGTCMVSAEDADENSIHMGSTDNGVTWFARTMSMVETRKIVVDGPIWLAVGGEPGGTEFASLSADGGETWSDVADLNDFKQPLRAAAGSDGGAWIALAQFSAYRMEFGTALPKYDVEPPLRAYVLAK